MRTSSVWFLGDLILLVQAAIGLFCVLLAAHVIRKILVERPSLKIERTKIDWRMKRNGVVLLTGIVLFVMMIAGVGYLATLVAGSLGLAMLAHDTVRRGQESGDVRQFLHRHRCLFFLVLLFAGVFIVLGLLLDEPRFVCLGLALFIWVAEIEYDRPSAQPVWQRLRISRRPSHLIYGWGVAFLIFLVLSMYAGGCAMSGKIDGGH